MPDVFGKPQPVVNGDTNTWGLKLNDIDLAAHDYVTLGQVGMVLSLDAGAATYLLHPKNKIPALIQSVSYATDSGTATISNIAINSSPITGLSSLAATTTFQEAIATAANVFGTSGTTNLNLTIGAISGATKLYLNFSVLQTDKRV